MTGKTIKLTLGLLAMLVWAGEVALAQALPEQLSVEKWFVGDWICEGTQYASLTAPGVQFTDRFSFRMTLRGSWLIYHIDQLKGPVKGKETLIGFATWDANAKVHVRRDMNIGGSRIDVTTPGWEGDKLVYTGYMVIGDEKLPVRHILTKKGNKAYDAKLEMGGADGKPMMWEEESCRKLNSSK